MYFDILTEVANFLISKLADIEAFYLTKGGWEGWAQCELTRFLYQRLGNNAVNVFRESNNPYQYSPHPNQRSDFYLQFLGLAPYVPVTIELKTESIYQEAVNATSLAARFNTDINKIQQVNPHGAAAQDLYAIGITCSAEGAQKVINILHINPAFNILLPNGGTLNLFYVNSRVA